jgi:hypothetical protein
MLIIQRWVELFNRPRLYPLYELVDRPTGTAVYCDPFASLRQTTSICTDFTQIASKVTRLWIHGFHTFESVRLVYKLVRHCANLTSLSLPWTAIRFLSTES